MVLKGECWFCHQTGPVARFTVPSVVALRRRAGEWKRGEWLGASEIELAEVCPACEPRVLAGERGTG